MSLSPGTRIGSYEILAPLGRGGMGEVWRARDTKLRREVAIKALPAEFAADLERRARFEREAHMLASLNHPNVAAIYGLEEAGDAAYLILELVEGETLAEKLASGPLPAEEALAIAAQIAAGLEAAHEAGVIHRDLKPSNVKLRPDGSVKVLDLGLARVVDPVTVQRDASQSPTVTTGGGTRSGVILGTAAYMSPEQARGRPLDKRTDIFSFGCLFFECLTGRTAFEGETVSDTLAAIIKSEPVWSHLPADTPTSVRKLLRRCLEKDPRRRLHDIADARLELEEALAAPPQAPVSAAIALPPASRAASVAWIGLGLLAGALAGVLLPRALTPRRRGEDWNAVHSVIRLPADTLLKPASSRPSMAFSPDGRKLVLRVFRGAVSQLYLRDLGRADAVPISGTEGGYDPFFSPDGEWLAFFSGNQLRKVALSGGPPAVLSDAPPVSAGGTWATDGSIIFAPRPNGGLARLLVGARAYQDLTTLDAASGDHAHVRPQMLPDGQNVLLIIRAGRDFDDINASNVAVHSLKTGRRRVLVEGATFARYVEPGYLLFTKGTTVFAAPCDSRKWELTGPAVPLIHDVLTGTNDGVPYLAVSDDGVLAYAGGGMASLPPSTVLWIDRSGRDEVLPLSDASFSIPRLSPDGKRLAIITQRTGGPRGSISVYDFARGNLSILTPEPGRHFCPVWSPDGRRIAYSSFEAGQPRLSWKAADGSGENEFLSPAGTPEFPTSWSPDGISLLYTTRAAGSIENMDLWLLSLNGKRERTPWMAGPDRKLAAFFSPDGRSVAYVSFESGKGEIYVTTYPGPGPKIKVSSDGGSEPAWAPGGREIFYRTADSLMVAPIQTQPELKVGQARVLLPDRYDRWGREDGSRNYDVSPDGSRFLFVKTQEVKQEPITQLHLIVNWPAELGLPRKK